MLKKIITVILSITFVYLQSSVSYAEAIHYRAFNNYNFNSEYYGRNNKGVAAKFNFKIPFGAKGRVNKESYYGFNLTYGQEFSRANPFQHGAIKEVNLIDSRFNRDGLRSLNAAGQVVVQTKNRTPKENKSGISYGFWGLIGIGAVVGICLAAGCLSDGDAPSS